MTDTTLAYPEIIDCGIYYNPSDGLYHTIILWKNSGGYGYMSFEGYSPSYIYYGLDICENIRTGLAGYIELSTNIVLPASLDFRAFRCDSDSQQNCTAITCSQRVQTSTFYGVYVRAKDTTVPSAPTGLTVIPGDKELNVSWNAVTNTDIFAYYVKLSHGGATDIEGFVTNNIRNIILSNLVNGTVYTVEVIAYNYSFLKGASASKTGTPAPPPCPVPVCSFSLTGG